MDHTFSSLSAYKSNDLWMASLNGDYKDRIWLRDSYFILLYYMFSNEVEETQRALDQILVLLGENENRPPICFDTDLNPVSIKNFQTGEPADIQNDVIGGTLWVYSSAKQRAYKLGKKWKNKINQLIELLADEKYWEQPDSGMWEMELDVRASSIGICVAGLTSLTAWGQWNQDVLNELITKGKETLKELLPKETSTRGCDAALLNLIWPFRIVDQKMGIQIIGRVLDHLVGTIGIKRFVGDPYYSCEGQEAEWALFVPQLLLALNTLGHYPKKEENHNNWRAVQKIKEAGYPESFVCQDRIANSNTPLAWTHAMCLMADHILLGEKSGRRMM